MVDCLDNELCDKTDMKCRVKQCDEQRTLIGGKIEGPKDISIGEKAVLKCQDGNVFKSDGAAQKSVEVTCTNSVPVPIFTTEDSPSPISGCQPGTAIIQI